MTAQSDEEGSQKCRATKGPGTAAGAILQSPWTWVIVGRSVPGKLCSTALVTVSFEILFRAFEDITPYFLIFYFDTEIPCKEAEPCN